MLANLLRFCRKLRESDFDVGSRDAATAARALLAVDVGDREQVFLALRAVLCRKVEDFPAFAMAFAHFWEASARLYLPAVGNGNPDAASGGALPSPPAAAAEETAAGTGAEKPPATGLPAYSPQSLLQKDFAAFTADELPELHRLARQVARRLVQRLSRRRRPHHRGPVDPARTFRRALRQGGEVLHLVRRRRRRQKVRLVALLDVSGSMQPYARFLLQFLMALTARLPRMETFVFSTGLRRVTREVRERRLEDAARTGVDWGGGTRMGASLAAFVAAHALDMLDRRATVLVLSDGLDVGEIAVLDRALVRIRELAGRILWLNPLAGDPEYEPLARGMRTALPYVDVLAPANSLASLLQLGHYLGRISA